jgi:hypothetical protein
VDVLPPAVPSLDKLYEMTSLPDERVVIRGVGWAFYEQLVDSIPYPNPDLGIEVDISPPEIDRPGIYAALRVPEVWRSLGPEVIIERLTDDGTYQPVEQSIFLPVRAEEIRRWVFEEDSSDESAWARRLRARVRAEVALRARG